MKVLKRDGKSEDVSFDKISRRIDVFVKKYNLNIDPIYITQKVCSRIYDGVPTSLIDEYTAELCITLSTEHPDFNKLAGYIIISNNHKNTSPSFSEAMEKVYNNTNINGDHKPLISEKIYKIIKKHKNKLNSILDYSRDYLIDYFGFKTLERAYLTNIKNEIIERPQHMFLRVSLGIHENDMKSVKETYNYMSQKYFIHATPTLFNSGTVRPQMSSCFLLSCGDSITDIYKNISDCAQISKWAGGIGIHVSSVRGNKSYIAGTNGSSNGIIPMLKVYNETARYVDQGGGKRKGSIAVYLEPWHCDIESFLDIRKNHGDENQRARDLFTAMWTPDLFMEKAEKNEEWCLFCPNECPGLNDVYGDDFKKLYEKYELEKKYRKKISARELMFKIITSQIETGTPYMLYKDSCNRKSNQQNIGVIKSSNLCAEIIEYTDKDMTAVCNLASIAVNNFYDEKTKIYDYEKLGKITTIITKNLNKIIDRNYYPIPETKKSNMELRPIGIGIQGFADLLFKMRLNFDSLEAREINKKIFACIYYNSVKTSMEISKKTKPYKYFKGSPLSKGLFQFDLWGKQGHSDFDWGQLRSDVMEYGVANSLLTALMPTASTSQILGNFECFECITSNIYVRRTLAGEFIVLNKYLIKDLLDLNLWNKEIKDRIIYDNGSIQNIDEIPQDIKNLYRTVWEISQRSVIDLSSERGIYIDQSQSMNIFIEKPTYRNMVSMHFYGWKSGLKTGMYYLRSRPKSKAQQFTIQLKKDTKKISLEEQKLLCSLENPESCLMCSG